MCKRCGKSVERAAGNGRAKSLVNIFRVKGQSLPHSGSQSSLFVTIAFHVEHGHVTLPLSQPDSPHLCGTDLPPAPKSSLRPFHDRCCGNKRDQYSGPLGRSVQPVPAPSDQVNTFLPPPTLRSPLRPAISRTQQNIRRNTPNRTRRQ